MNHQVMTLLSGSAEGISKDALLQLIKLRQAKVGVIGLGYVGLPLLRAMTGVGFPTTGYDIDVDTGEPRESPTLLPATNFRVILKHAEGRWLVDEFEALQ